MKKIISFALLIALIATMAVVANAGSGGQKYAQGDVKQVATGSITIDGVKDAAYTGTAKIVANTDSGQGGGNVNNSTSTTYLLWDSTSLIVFTEVVDSTPLVMELSHYILRSCDADCMEYFIVWDNSDCPDVQRYVNGSADLYQYRATFTNGLNNGYFVDGYALEGFANGEETGSIFDATASTKIRAGIVKPTAAGYNVEMQINLATSNKDGAGNYTYGDGSQIAFVTHFFDFWGGTASYDRMTIMYSDPTGNTKATAVMKSAWQAHDYWYVELQGDAADTTAAPVDDTTVDPAAALATAKTNAIAELDALVAGRTYSTFNQTIINTYLTASKDAINAAADAAEVATILADAKAAISAIAYTAGTTAAPVTTSKATTSAPQTSDVAVAAFAILASLAVAGVVVAKKVK